MINIRIANGNNARAANATKLFRNSNRICSQKNYSEIEPKYSEILQELHQNDGEGSQPSWKTNNGHSRVTNRPPI